MGSKWPWFIVVILVVIIIILLVRPCPKCPDCPPGPATEMGMTVELIFNTGCSPEKPALSRSGDNNHIRWKNTTSAERTITFTSQWPFFEPKADIVIPAGALSQWFTLDPAKANATCPYQVNDSLFGPGTPPDDPAVSAGD